MEYLNRICHPDKKKSFFSVKVTNIDELLKYHLLFLDNCLRDCMLTSVHLLRHIHKIMATCVMFANAMDNVDDDDDYDSLPGAVVASFNNNFTEQLRQLLDAISKEDGPSTWINWWWTTTYINEYYS